MNRCFVAYTNWLSRPRSHFQCYKMQLNIKLKYSDHPIFYVCTANNTGVYRHYSTFFYATLLVVTPYTAKNDIYAWNTLQLHCTGHVLCNRLSQFTARYYFLFLFIVEYSRRSLISFGISLQLHIISLDIQSGAVTLLTGNIAGLRILLVIAQLAMHVSVHDRWICVCCIILNACVDMGSKAFALKCLIICRLRHVFRGLDVSLGCYQFQDFNADIRHR